MIKITSHVSVQVTLLHVFNCRSHIKLIILDKVWKIIVYLYQENDKDNVVNDSTILIKKNNFMHYLHGKHFTFSYLLAHNTRHISIIVSLETM